ncbi:glycosyltransferase family 4 protein [Staphylococcus saprophyticus]|uniref:glycosyltransferase family 4 protein n=1 Tax=Staphylococcus saprophyticus TaxID=29385 RepID=UPI0011A91720|nr:glycosyltransferase family 4 protein [Staphylococcus saprophyticus]
MNLMHINSDYGNTIYKSLSMHLQKLGINQKVFKFIRPKMYKNDIYDDFVDLRINYNNIDRYFFHIKHKKALNDFLNLYKNEKIDLIHAHTLFSNGYIAYKVFKKKSIPYVVTVRGTDITVFMKYMKHLKKIGLRIILNAKQIIFVSHAHKNLVLKKYIPKKYMDIIKSKIVVLPNGIDDFYLENQYSPKKLNSANELNIITVGWINKNKNQISVCKAIRILNNKGYKINYRVIGGMENKDKYGDLINELKDFDFIELVPRKNKYDLLNEYRDADITAMVSFNETFGLTYIESLTQSTPIIYSENRGIDGYFPDGEVGFKASPTSIEDIAEKIEMTINNYNFLSNNSTKKVNEFSWEKISIQLKDIYEA